MPAQNAAPKALHSALVIDKTNADPVSNQGNLKSTRWVPLNEAARVVHLSTQTLRLDVTAGQLAMRRGTRGQIEVDLDAAIDKYAGGTPLVTRMFTAFEDGRTPIEMTIDSGLDPALVKRLFEHWLDLRPEQNAKVAAMKLRCRECERTEAQRIAFAKEFAEACVSSRTQDVRCCSRCYVPLTWNDDGENA